MRAGLDVAFASLQLMFDPRSVAVVASLGCDRGGSLLESPSGEVQERVARLVDLGLIAQQHDGFRVDQDRAAATINALRRTLRDVA